MQLYKSRFLLCNLTIKWLKKRWIKYFCLAFEQVKNSDKMYSPWYLIKEKRLIIIWSLHAVLVFCSSKFIYNNTINKVLTLDEKAEVSSVELNLASSQKLLFIGDMTSDVGGLGGRTDMCGTGLKGSVGLKTEDKKFNGPQQVSSREENWLSWGRFAFTSVWLLESVLLLLLLTRHVLWHWRQTASGRSEFADVDFTVFWNKKSKNRP